MNMIPGFWMEPVYPAEFTFTKVFQFCWAIVRLAPQGREYLRMRVLHSRTGTEL